MGVVKTEEDVLDNDKTTSWASCIIGFFFEIRKPILDILEKGKFLLEKYDSRIFDLDHQSWTSSGTDPLSLRD